MKSIAADRMTNSKSVRSKKKILRERETVKHRHKVIKKRKMKGWGSATYMKNIHKSYNAPMANTEKAIKLKSTLCILHKKMQDIFKILKENSPPERKLKTTNVVFCIKRNILSDAHPLSFVLLL